MFFKIQTLFLVKIKKRKNEPFPCFLPKTDFFFDGFSFCVQSGNRKNSSPFLFMFVVFLPSKRTGNSYLVGPVGGAISRTLEELVYDPYQIQPETRGGCWQLADWRNKLSPKLLRAFFWKYAMFRIISKTLNFFPLILLSSIRHTGTHASACMRAGASYMSRLIDVSAVR